MMLIKIRNFDFVLKSFPHRITFFWKIAYYIDIIYLFSYIQNTHSNKYLYHDTLT